MHPLGVFYPRSCLALLIFISGLLFASPVLAWSDFKSSLRAKSSSFGSKGPNYEFYIEGGFDVYDWDKPGAILRDDREFIKANIPNVNFDGSVDDSGTGGMLYLGGEWKINDEGPSPGSNLYLGTRVGIGIFPDFSVTERAHWREFQFVNGNNNFNGNDPVQEIDNRIDAEIELDGGLTYGLEFNARWEVTKNVSIGPYIRWDRFEIERKLEASFFMNNVLYDRTSERRDIDDTAFGYGVHLGLSFGDDNPWYARLSYGVAEVDEFDLDRISLSVYRELGGHDHHVERN